MKAAKIVFFPNVSKKSKKTNDLPIYIRISKGTTKAEAKLDVALKESELANWNAFTQRLDIKGNVVNKRLEEIEFDFEGLPHRFKYDFEQFTPSEIKEKLFGGSYLKEPEHIKARDYLEDYYLNVVLTNSNISVGTKKNYRKSINHFNKYLNYVRQGTITLKNFSSLMAFGFYDYLQKDIPPQRKGDERKNAIKDYSASSIVIKISVIFSRACDTELISKNPFSKVKLQRKYPKKPHLEIGEINAIIQLNLKNDKKLEVYRDIFLFGIFTGLPYADIYAMRKSNIQVEKGEYVYCGTREKTKEPIKQILVDEAVSLIQKYDNDVETMYEERIFPARHLNNMNDSLKLIQAKAGIHKTLTTHISRHTANQMLNDIGYINGDVINYMLGWSNSRQGMRMNYKSISFEILLYAKNQFQKFITQNFNYNI